MADTFSRDSLATYEKGPQKTVPDTTNPFRGARSAGVADPAAIAAVAAGNVDVSGGKQTAAAATVDTDAPVVDEDGTLGEPAADLVGDGTSDENSASSTDTGDSGADADPNADLAGTTEEESSEPTPKKGSAQERIVELNDRLEGAMVFGKSMQEQLKAQIEINQRLRVNSGGSPTPEAAAAAPRPAVATDVGSMPKMTDPDINYDEDKYQSKMEKWTTAVADQRARAIVNEITGASAARELEAAVNAKVTAYEKDHPEFKETVHDNEVLRSNQLAPAAGLAVARSEYTAELLMKFGSDPAYAIRVARMSPHQQEAEVYQLIGEIRAEKKALGAKNKTTNAQQGGAKPPAKKSVTQAPPPPRPTPAAGRTSFNPLDPNSSMDDFVRSHRAGKQSARDANRKSRGLG